MNCRANACTVADLLAENDIAPYIRAAGHAVRKPFMLGRRRLLDYIVL